MTISSLFLLCVGASHASDTKAPVVEDGSAEKKAAGLPWECEPDPALPNVLILGDSISIGYTLQVRELLKGKANVFRPLAAGSNGSPVNPENCLASGNGIKQIARWTASQKWAVIHFNFGLHDLKYVQAGKLDKTTGHQVASVETYENNLRTLVPLLRNTGAKLIFATTTVIPAGAPGRFEGDELAYNAAALKVMTQNHIAVNDLHSLTASFPSELFQGPGNVHYTNDGSERLAQQVAKAILNAMAEVQN